MSERRIFVYGTLQFPRIARAVTGRSLAGRAARLPGYARYQVKGEPFPGIAPAEGAAVDGVVLEGVDARALARMDDFEGPLYRREHVEVQPDDADAPVSAEAYVVRARWRTRLANADWDPEAFARRWHDAYVRELGGDRRAGRAG